MELRTLGGQGLAVCAQGLGLMGMSAFYGSTDEAESLATIDRALELGVTLFDTAEIYGPFINEQLLGKALTGRRDQAVIATKTGIEIGDDGAVTGLNGRPEYIRRALDRSLRHLGTDYVDLYYLHRVDPQVPIEDTVGAMAELVDAGKVRHIGLSEVAPQTIRRAHAHPPADRGPDRVLALRARHRAGRGHGHPATSSGSAWSPTRRWGAASCPARSPARTTSPPTTTAAPTPASRARTSTATWPWSTRSAGWPPPRRSHPPSWRSPGSSTRARSPSPAPSVAATWRRTVVAAAVTITADELAAIDAVAPHGIVSGDRYTPELMQLLNG